MARKITVEEALEVLRSVDPAELERTAQAKLTAQTHALRSITTACKAAVEVATEEDADLVKSFVLVGAALAETIGNRVDTGLKELKQAYLIGNVDKRAPQGTVRLQKEATHFFREAVKVRDNPAIDFVLTVGALLHNNGSEPEEVQELELEPTA